MTALNKKPNKGLQKQLDSDRINSILENLLGVQVDGAVWFKIWKQLLGPLWEELGSQLEEDLENE